MKREAPPPPTSVFCAPEPSLKPVYYLRKADRAYPDAAKDPLWDEIYAALRVQLTWGGLIPLSARHLAAVNATKDSAYRRYFRRPRGTLGAADAFHQGPAVFAVEHEQQHIGMRLRELVFDLDLPDLDAEALRPCDCPQAPKKRICRDCWRGFVPLVRRVVEHRLQVDWAISGLLWVFSGSKGVHATSNSRTAAMFNRRTRAAITAGVMRPLDADADTSLLGYLKDDARRAGGPFCNADDSWLERPAFRARLLAHLGSLHLAGSLEQIWASREPGTTHTTAFWAFLDHSESALTSELWAAIASLLWVPRLDAAVTEDPAHLNKTAFAIHSSAQRVAVPLEAATMARFDPTAMPTVNRLLADRVLEEQWLRPALNVYLHWLRGARYPSASGKK